jgi:SAM-dependent methyltransferase
MVEPAQALLWSVDPMTHAPAPFDAVAAGYDAAFSDRLLARWLRAAVQERLAHAFRPGDHVLELGCGTGEDALWLARRGVRVTATDVSSGMLDVARRKAAAAGQVEQVRWLRFDFASPTAPPWTGTDFDGAFSNFGALNCLPDRAPLAEAMAGCVRSGGLVVLVVMGPLCPWEVGWHLVRLRPRTAVRRLRGGREGHLGDGASVRVWYPSPRRLAAELRPWFDHLDTVGIGVLLPPSYAGQLVDRWPGAFRYLKALERRIAGRFPFTWLNDHYLAVFQRR